MRGLKTALYTFASILGLLALLVGAGVAYTWYNGQRGPASIADTQSVEAQTVAPAAKKIQLAPNAAVGATVQEISSPVAPGTNATMTVKTTMGATCSIKVKYNEIPSKDSGLIPKEADEYGLASWSWTVEETVPVGKWPADVTCRLGKKSAEVRGELVVKAE